MLLLAGGEQSVLKAEGINDDGYRLWLNYKLLTDDDLKQSYIQYVNRIYIADCKYKDAICTELGLGLKDMLALDPEFTTAASARLHIQLCDDNKLGDEGYTISRDNDKIYLKAFSDAGLLYATFHFIRLIQCGQSSDHLNIREVPALSLRQLNHWDDLDGNIERGYAGTSLWKWDELPAKISFRYKDYARANASIGINGVVLNNVNADPRILRRDYLEKVAALADVFRQYNIRIYLTANFAAPMKPSTTPEVMKQWGGVGDLDTADPRNSQVEAWWKAKVDEIYSLIPDFGGFLVKANSEGMPGPQDYNCSHAEGANMLARVLKPHNGIVMWRTFVYNQEIDKDRMKRSYKEFIFLDGKFEDNVILQTKTGPLDFQPSEPVQPLFGAMKLTSLMPELQITQEYIGHSTYLVYLLPMWRNFFDFDTHCKGKNSTVSEIVTGGIYNQRYKAIAGVANTGNTRNWTGHHFAQANWYAFGRLAWNPDESSTKITSEWIKATWHCDDNTTKVIAEMMMPTWNNFVCANSPYSLGLTTQIADHFYAGFDIRANKEWKINVKGIGSDRTKSGSDYVSQYFEPNRSLFNNIKTCPELYLLCFHFVPWEHKMKSGYTLQEEMLSNLKKGILQVTKNIQLWESIHTKIDEGRYKDVRNSLIKEKADATIFYESAISFFSKYTSNP